MDGNKEIITITDQETGEKFAFKPASLIADVRDRLLDRRRIQVENRQWSKLSEAEQQDEINGMTALSHMLVSAAIDVVGTAGLTCAYVEVSKFAVDVEKGEVTITAKGTASDAMLTKLAHAKGRPCRLAVLEKGQFNSEGEVVVPDPDQADLFTDDDEAPAASEPLADDDEIIDPETGEITSKYDTAAAMADAIENDPAATEEEKATLSGDNATDPADMETDPADMTNEAEPEIEPAQASADTKTAPEGDDETPDAYQEGLKAAADNLGPDECTYDGGTDEHLKWHEGRNKGLEEIEDLRQEGREARTDGMAPTRCKWTKGTAPHRWWMEGYEQVKATESS